MQKRYVYRRSLHAIILLVIMVLQMGVRDLHLHHHAEQEDVTCSDCQHHKVHSGHIIDWDGEDGCCPLCQLTSTPFTQPETIQLNTVSLVRQTTDFYFLAFIPKSDGSAITLRGPPCFLL